MFLSVYLYSSAPKSLFTSVSYIVAIMKKETKIQLIGFEMLEKKVNKSGNSGRVYVPIEWVEKRVKIILLEQ